MWKGDRFRGRSTREKTSADALTIRSHSVEVWNQTLSAAFDGMEGDSFDRDNFSAGLTLINTGGVRFAEADAPAGVVRRTSEHVRNSSSRNLMIHLLLDGEVKIRQFGREATLQPGDICLADTSLPYQFDLSRTSRIICIAVPYHQLRGRLDHAEMLAGHAISGGEAIGRLAGACITAAWSEVSGNPETTLSDGAVRAVLDLLAAVPVKFDCISRGRTDALYRKACDLIDLRKCDPEFSIENLAATLGTSMRSLQRAFAIRDETPGRYLNRRRIGAAAVQLSSSSLAAESITRIAFGLGFNDLTHFERCFSRRYGCTPSVFRAQYR
jgi:AraC-like DNA-binding protein